MKSLQREPPRVVRSPRFSIRWAGELLWSLTVHRVTVRYKESVFGFGWIFLQPVALTIIFTYIFHRFARIPSGDTPYPLFVAIGVVGWSLTALVVSQSAMILTGHAPLLKRVALPRILLPLSVVTATVVDLCVMVIMLAGLFTYYRYPLPWTAGWVLLLLPIHLALLFGVSCMLSIANVLLRDAGHAIPSLLQLWFFASPVFYPSSMVPGEFRVLAQWNPMAGLIEGYRSALLLGKPPSLYLLGPAIVTSIAVLIVGVAWFQRLEKTVSDRI